MPILSPKTHNLTEKNFRIVLMVLKICTGDLRGKTLTSTNTARELRPTQALLREAIINTCLSFFDFDLSEKRVLDVFAGTGAVGFEFMSNHAKEVTFIERDFKCVKLLKTNIENLNLNAVATTIPLDINKAIPKISKKKFEIIFLDPPYKLNQENFEKIVESLIAAKLLAERSLLIIESGSDNWESRSFGGCLAELNLVKEKNYGDSSVFFYT